VYLSSSTTFASPPAYSKRNHRVWARKPEMDGRNRFPPFLLYPFSLLDLRRRAENQELLFLEERRWLGSPAAGTRPLTPGHAEREGKGLPAKCTAKGPDPRPPASPARCRGARPARGPGTSPPPEDNTEGRGSWRTSWGSDHPKYLGSQISGRP